MEHLGKYLDQIGIILNLFAGLLLTPEAIGVEKIMKWELKIKSAFARNLMKIEYLKESLSIIQNRARQFFGPYLQSISIVILLWLGYTIIKFSWNYFFNTIILRDAIYYLMRVSLFWFYFPLTLVFLLFGYRAYRVNTQRKDDDPEKKDYSPVSIWLLFIWPLFLLIYVLVHIIIVPIIVISNLFLSLIRMLLNYILRLLGGKGQLKNVFLRSGLVLFILGTIIQFIAISI